MIKMGKCALVILLFVTSIFSSLKAAVITGFGTGDFAFDSNSSNVTPSQTVNAFTFIGSGDSFFAGTLSSGTSGISSLSAVYLTATVNTYTPVSPVFYIDLYDADFDYRTYVGSWSGFVTGASQEFALTYTSTTLSGGGTFDGTASAIGVRNGSTGGSLNINFDTLATTAAIPEPVTYAALFGAASLGLAVWRKRRKSV